MDLIDQFIAQYRKEFDYYDAAARLTQGILESELASEGVRALVTSRAKDISRLEEKCRGRLEGRDYSSVSDIYADIADLAGVRVALYFPGDIERVERLIFEYFDQLEEPRRFPPTTSPPPGKRFSGYAARHYRVRPKASRLDERSLRHADARVEVQVASVLMHAWSEVEHDLKYKPTTGQLSEDEEAILDELNGLVLSGEIGLERLQKAVKARVASSVSPFTSSYDLADYLSRNMSAASTLPWGDSGIGRVDELYSLVTQLKLNTPAEMEQFLQELHSNFEERPLAEQVIDKIIEGDEQRSRLYLSIQSARKWATGAPSDSRYKMAIGKFVSSWTEFELVASDVIELPGRFARTLTPGVYVKMLSERAPNEYGDLLRLRDMRNNLVHGRSQYDFEELENAAERLQEIVSKLCRGIGLKEGAEGN